MRSRPRIVGFVCALIVTGVLCGIWGLSRDSMQSTFRLSDGTSITLRRIAYQKRYRISTGDRFRDSLGPLLPEAVAKWLGCRYSSYGDTNQLSCCLEIEGPSGSHFFVSGISLFDEHGCESGLVNPYPYPSPRLLFATFYYCPPRPKKLGIRVYQGQTVVAEFSDRNPASRRGLQSKPESSVAAKTNCW